MSGYKRNVSLKKRNSELHQKMTDLNDDMIALETGFCWHFTWRVHHGWKEMTMADGALGRQVN